ncbi:hypothetical protein [Streptomyces sp. NPDC053048]|uniref:hypothetical protein n=1 Tax=Streptomyces sp. NPDC053048 TaxID=3365694 RepID=UPI0037D6A146
MATTTPSVSAEPAPVTKPALEPVPVDGCDVCAALAKSREGARANGDHGYVAMVNEELTTHPHVRAARS